MAIDSYATLKSAVQTYTVRPDSVFGNMVPTFVELAEARLYDGAGEPGDDMYSPPLRSSVMEVTGSIAVAAGVGTLPASALEVRKIYAEDNLSGITYQTPERFEELNANASAGRPVYYTVEANQIKITPAVTGNLLLAYASRYPAITTSNTTGPLIIAHGTLYLEAVLFEAFTFLQEGDSAKAHFLKFKSLLQGANRTSASMRYPGPKRVVSRLVFP